MASAPEILITAGVVGVLASIVGGGMKAFGAELPIVSSTRRQALLFLVGVAFVAAGLLIQARSQFVAEETKPPSGQDRQSAENIQTDAPASDDTLLSYFAPEHTIERLYGAPVEERPWEHGTYKLYLDGEEQSHTWLRDYRGGTGRVALATYTEDPGTYLPNSSNVTVGSFTLREALDECSKLSYDGVALAFVVHGCGATNATGRLYRAFVFTAPSAWNQSVELIPACTEIDRVPEQNRGTYLRQQCPQALSLKSSGWALSHDEAELDRVLPDFLTMLSPSQ
jgi:hypothetical protein